LCSWAVWLRCSSTVLKPSQGRVTQPRLSSLVQGWQWWWCLTHHCMVPGIALRGCMLLPLLGCDLVSPGIGLGYMRIVSALTKLGRQPPCLCCRAPEKAWDVGKVGIAWGLCVGQQNSVALANMLEVLGSKRGDSCPCYGDWVGFTALLSVLWGQVVAAAKWSWSYWLCFRVQSYANTHSTLRTSFWALLLWDLAELLGTWGCLARLRGQVRVALAAPNEPYQMSLIKGCLQPLL